MATAPIFSKSQFKWSKMDDAETLTLEEGEVKLRSFSKSSSGSAGGGEEMRDEMPLLVGHNKGDEIQTEYGIINVHVQGDPSKPAIITYHDIGLNHTTQFQTFFNHDDMLPITKNFCIYHVNAPGQQEGAIERTPGLLYPEMDQLGQMFLPILNYYGLKTFIGFGVGAGGNILCRFALAYPKKVEALCLINCVSTQAGWIEWGYQKLSAFYLKGGKGMTQFTQDYLLWHHFGTDTMERNQDLVQVYRNHMLKSINPLNLAYFLESYIKRSDLRIVRELDPEKKKTARTINCEVLLISGNKSPHLRETVDMNARLDPSKSTWMKLSDCGGMVLEEQPAKVAQAFRLFLQGQGYMVSLGLSHLKETRSSSNPNPPITLKDFVLLDEVDSAEC